MGTEALGGLWEQVWGAQDLGLHRRPWTETHEACGGEGDSWKLSQDPQPCPLHPQPPPAQSWWRCRRCSRSRSRGPCGAPRCWTFPGCAAPLWMRGPRMVWRGENGSGCLRTARAEHSGGLLGLWGSKNQTDVTKFYIYILSSVNWFKNKSECQNKILAGVLQKQEPGHVRAFM